MFSSASAISCAAWRAMATISGLAPSTCEVTASEPTIRPVIGCLTGAPAHASSASAALKCSAPRTNTTPRASMGVPSPLVPKDCSEKSKPSTALARSMVRSSCASTIRRETMRPPSRRRGRGHPRIGEIRLPLVQDPACGAQDDTVRVDIPENLRSGLGVNVRRDRAAPALLDLLGDERRRNGCPE
jgi:hypothetical protein